MSYDLKALDPDVEGFRLGAFSFPVLLEACGYLFPALQKNGRWYCVFGVDERMPQGDTYPRLISNDGFTVTAEEARIMARMARNFVAVQRSLPDENVHDTLMAKAEITRDDVTRLLEKAMHGRDAGEPWPQKIRSDFTDKFEKFAEWADRSGGFEIW